VLKLSKELCHTQFLSLNGSLISCMILACFLHCLSSPAPGLKSGYNHCPFVSTLINTKILNTKMLLYFINRVEQGWLMSIVTVATISAMVPPARSILCSTNLLALVTTAFKHKNSCITNCDVSLQPFQFSTWNKQELAHYILNIVCNNNN